MPSHSSNLLSLSHVLYVSVVATENSTESGINLAAEKPLGTEQRDEKGVANSRLVVRG